MNFIDKHIMRYLLQVKNVGPISKSCKNFYWIFDSVSGNYKHKGLVFRNVKNSVRRVLKNKINPINSENYVDIRVKMVIFKYLSKIWTER